MQIDDTPSPPEPSITSGSSTTTAPPAKLTFWTVLKSYPGTWVGQVAWSLSDVLAKLVLPAFVLDLYENSSTAPTVFGYVTALAALCQFIALPIIGSASQTYGRRRALIVCAAVTVVSSAMLIPVTARHMMPLVFFSQMLHGLSAGVTALNYTVGIDSLPQPFHATFSGLVAVFSVPVPYVIASPIVLIAFGRVSITVFFIVSTLFAIISLFTFIFFTKETLAPSHRLPWRWRSANPIVACLHWARRRFINLFFLSYMAFSFTIVFLTSFSFFFAHYRFGISYNQFLPVAIALVLILILGFSIAGPVCRRIGIHRGYAIGLMFCLVIPWVMIIAPTFALFAVGLLVAFPVTLSPPAASAIVAARTLPVEQGQFQSYYTSIFLLGAVLCQVSMGPLMSATIESDNIFVRSACPIVVIGVMCFGIAAYVLAVRCVGGSVLMRRMSKPLILMHTGDGMRRAASRSFSASPTEDMRVSTVASSVPCGPTAAAIAEDAVDKSRTTGDEESGHATYGAMDRTFTGQNIEYEVDLFQAQADAEAACMDNQQCANEQPVPDFEVLHHDLGVTFEQPHDADIPPSNMRPAVDVGSIELQTASAAPGTGGETEVQTMKMP
jgi:DHA1 family tetracycline resistance protein-like MFS transporter